MKLLYCSFIFLITVSNFACSSKLVNVKLHVLDEDNQAVENARVDMGFLLSHGGNRFSALTDVDGYIEAADYGTYGQKIIINKDGYYQSKIRTGYGDQNLSMLLRKKKNPIAMYAKDSHIKLDKRNKSYGFDILKGDLVSSYGKGVISDIFIRFERSMKDFSNYKETLSVVFDNENDGLQKALINKDWQISEFKSDYYAPVSGYKRKMDFISAASNDLILKSTNKNKPLYLRIRTIIKDNTIISAHYCKVFPGIEIYGEFSDTPTMRFTYYCNPTPNERNVEFDLKRNLLTDLKPEERVLEP